MKTLTISEQATSIRPADFTDELIAAWLVGIDAADSTKANFQRGLVRFLDPASVNVWLACA